MVTTTNGVKKALAPAVQPPRMTLAAVTRGKVARPARVLLYGVEGIGKSTFAANAPSPIFLGTEDGTAQLDVARFPEPHRWEDFYEAVKTLETDEHAFRTLVIDTLDWAEPLCWDAVCRDSGKKHIEDLGYGKGYVSAVDKWRGLLARLDGLRSRKGMHVVLLAHSLVKNFKNPEGDDFDRYQLKLHEKSAGLIKEWADAVLFSNHETLTETKGQRTRGVSTGARLLYTERRAAFDAKNRYDLPPELPLDWAEFEAGMAAHAPASPDDLKKQLDEMLAKLPEDLQVKARASMVKAGDDGAKLAQLADWARGKVALTTKVEAA